MIVKELSILAMFGICSIEDIKTRQIPVKWITAFAAEACLCRLFLYKQPAIGLLAAIFPGLVILVFAFLSRGSIGKGDGYLMIVTGLFLGVKDTFRIFIYAIFLSFIYALYLCVIKKKSRKYEMPFIPFLFIAFAGDLIINNYF